MYLNYEEKYKEALEAIKKLQEGHPTAHVIQDWVKENFPELLETEDDKMRSRTIFLLGYFKEVYMEDAQKCIAWLEAQKQLNWSEEDERNIERIETILKGNGIVDGNRTELIEWLKSIRPCFVGTQNESWPNLSNCKHDCKSCMAKCFYRKEPYQERMDYDKLKEGIDEAATEWNSKAYFAPIAMVMDGNGHPCGTKQYTTTHADSFKAGVEWVIKKLKEFEA